MQPLKRFLWLARIVGLMSLGFLLFMLGAHLIEGGDGSSFASTAELLSFIFFPIGLVVGLALCFWRPIAGGLFVIIDMLAFFIIRPDLILDPIFAFLAMPGVAFLLYGIFKRKMAPK